MVVDWTPRSAELPKSVEGEIVGGGVFAAIICRDACSLPPPPASQWSQVNGISFFIVQPCQASPGSCSSSALSPSGKRSSHGHHINDAEPILPDPGASYRRCLPRYQAHMNCLCSSWSPSPRFTTLHGSRSGQRLTCSLACTSRSTLLPYISAMHCSLARLRACSQRHRKLCCND